MIQFISTKKASLPGGHYSQAVVFQNLIFVSGQLPITPEGKKITGHISDQTRQVLDNVQAILEDAGSNLSSVLKSTIYISDITLWDQVNNIYADYFQDHKPARAVVPTKDLHHGFLIEMEVIAVKP
jgi:2-iminobutanoate/2-iminopropanoate deaminase